MNLNKLIKDLPQEDKADIIKALAVMGLALQDPSFLVNVIGGRRYKEIDELATETVNILFQAMVNKTPDALTVEQLLLGVVPEPAVVVDMYDVYTSMTRA